MRMDSSGSWNAEGHLTLHFSLSGSQDICIWIFARASVEFWAVAAKRLGNWKFRIQIRTFQEVCDRCRGTCGFS